MSNNKINKIEDIYIALIRKYNEWHETFIAGFDNHSGHCCNCCPELYKRENLIVIDNRYYPSDNYRYEIWEKDGIKIEIYTQGNYTAFIPYEFLIDMGFKYIEEGEFDKEVII